MAERLSEETKNLVIKTYSYVEGSRELRHIAAAVAYLYTTSLHGSCPSAAPRSNITRDARVHVPMRYNNPRGGMKPLNSMLRYTFNYFYDIQRMMNFDDYEARDDVKNIVFFRARSVCAAISDAFDILVDADLSRNRDSTASRLFRMICDSILVLPRTCAEERAAEAAERRRAAAAADARAKEETARIEAKKVEDTAAQAAADEAARAIGFKDAADARSAGVATAAEIW